MQVFVHARWALHQLSCIRRTEDSIWITILSLAIVEHNLVDTQENKNPEFSFPDKLRGICREDWVIADPLV